jgi:hypothetical protein
MISRGVSTSLRIRLGVRDTAGHGTIPVNRLY